MADPRRITRPDARLLQRAVGHRGARVIQRVGNPEEPDIGNRPALEGEQPYLGK